MTLIGALLAPICPAAPPPTAAHHDTPVVELRALDADNDVLAIILSGDGGWTDLDRDFGRAFQKKNGSPNCRFLPRFLICAMPLIIFVCLRKKTTKTYLKNLCLLEKGTLI